MKIVFMGTPVFSVPCLASLTEAGHEVAGVFTQPDKPKNRGHKMQMTPVKEFAVEKNIPVYQPLSLRKGDDAEKSLEILKQINPDCIVVVAYGQILPKAILDLPKYGCINVHASLLPMYRGAAPIQRCIIDGVTESGVTTMYMAEGLDTGDMILKEAVSVSEKMTASELHDMLAQTGAKLITETLKRLEAGTATRTPQSDENTCYAQMISKEDCRINFADSAKNVYNMIRGLSASPCAFTFLGDKRLKVYFAEPADGEYDFPAGTVVNTQNFTVVCGDRKAVKFTDIQLEGGKRINVNEFLRGRKIEENTVLG